jgi:hypothetical protein
VCGRGGNTTIPNCCRSPGDYHVVVIILYDCVIYRQVYLVFQVGNGNKGDMAVDNIFINVDLADCESEINYTTHFVNVIVKNISMSADTSLFNTYYVTCRIAEKR